VAHFRKTSTVQFLTKEGLETLAPTIRKIAKTEGLVAHAESVNIRCPVPEKKDKKSGKKN
jgi:histidinol dehydrogenase